MGTDGQPTRGRAYHCYRRIIPTRVKSCHWRGQTCVVSMFLSIAHIHATEGAPCNPLVSQAPLVALGPSYLPPALDPFPPGARLRHCGDQSTSSKPLVERGEQKEERETPSLVFWH